MAILASGSSLAGLLPGAWSRVRACVLFLWVDPRKQRLQFLVQFLEVPISFFAILLRIKAVGLCRVRQHDDIASELDLQAKRRRRKVCRVWDRMNRLLIGKGSHIAEISLKPPHASGNVGHHHVFERKPWGLYLLLIVNLGQFVLLLAFGLLVSRPLGGQLLLEFGPRVLHL